MSAVATRAPVILHVCSFFWTSQVHARLFKALHEQTGIRQIVYAPVKPGSAGQDRQTPGARDDARDFGEVHTLDCLSLATSLSSRHRGRVTIDTLRDRNLLSELNAVEVLAVHAHSAYMDGFAAAYLADRVGSGYCLSFRMTDTRFCFRYRPYATWFMRRLAARARRVLVISQGDVARVAHRLSLPKARIACLGSGLDDADIAAARRSKARPDPAHPPLVLTMGKRGYAYKAVDVTIRACAMAFDRSLDPASDEPSWSLEVLGMTRQAFRETHGRGVPDALLDRHVRFLGRIDDRDAVRERLHGADLFVLPSRETYGIAFLEAIGQCTPVVHLAGYAIDGVFGGTWIGAAATDQSVESVADAMRRARTGNGGVLGPFARNPVADHSWAALAKRYRALVLGAQPSNSSHGDGTLHRLPDGGDC